MDYIGLDSKNVGDALTSLESATDVKLALKQTIADIFVSTEQTGTGAAQNIAHGLGSIPSKVLIAIQTSAGAVSIVEGVHTTTNVVVTVTLGDTFKVLAFK